MDKQLTLKGEINLSGVGLHTGATVNIKILPAKDNHGYKFKRVDLEGEPIIPADVNLVVSTDRGTTLEKNGARVYTMEHLLAALYGKGIDNALIELDGPEIPILDGSSKIYIDEINKVGIVEQDAEKDYLELDENLKFELAEKGIEFLAVPDTEFRLTVMVDYKSPILGTQHATMMNLNEFENEIAHCRTFVFLKELEFLAEQGLIKGGDLDNAIVLVERPDVTKEELDALAKKLGRDANLDVNYTGMGLLNNSELRESNEPARHKLLDIVGDLALVGKPIKAHILAARPGHHGNTEFGKVLKQQILKQKKAGKKFDISKTVYDINDIEKMLPHRYPFLMVDRVIHVDEDGATGLKNITMNEPQFTGHFPGNPIMPGVLQIEAMAQVGGIFALHDKEDAELYSTYFVKIDKVKFKQKVIPGDTVVFEVKLLSPVRRGMYHMQGTAYVNGQVVSEAEMMAQVIKDKA